MKIRKAHPKELGRIVAFYRDNDYTTTVGPDDTIVVAEHGGGLCGAVRIVEEHGVLVLRGMRVRKDMRKRGIGGGLLEAVELIVSGRGCFCIPHRYLDSFYGRIGFSKIDAVKAPLFLRERCTEYRLEYGLDVIIMHKPGQDAGR